MVAKKHDIKKILPIAAGVFGAAAALAAAALTKKSNRQKVEKFVKVLKKQSEVLKDKGIEAFDSVVDKADSLRQEMETATKKIKNEDLKTSKYKKKPAQKAVK